eukprot:COSAG02_NODE_1875_length_10575_cov_19.141848_5_plen_87_part_00
MRNERTARMLQSAIERQSGVVQNYNYAVGKSRSEILFENVYLGTIYIQCQDRQYLQYPAAVAKVTLIGRGLSMTRNANTAHKSERC